MTTELKYNRLVVVRTLGLISDQRTKKQGSKGTAIKL